MFMAHFVTLVEKKKAMDKYTIYAVLGILFVIYLFITFYNKRRSNRRKDRKFMEGYKRRDGKRNEET